MKEIRDETTPKEGTTLEPEDSTADTPAVEPDEGPVIKLPEINPLDKEMFNRLVALRKDICAAEGVPPYVVFHNKTMWEMARQLPDSLEALARIEGIGQAKLERYGARFLAVINEGGAA
jgi:superfamily II DNA helicase RecQ